MVNPVAQQAMIRGRLQSPLRDYNEALHWTDTAMQTIRKINTQSSDIKEAYEDEVREAILALDELSKVIEGAGGEWPEDSLNRF